MWRREPTLALVLLLAGCAAGSHGAEGSTTSTAPVISIETPTTSTAVRHPEELLAGPGPEVAVSGGFLPAEVTTAITSRGGELADTTSWDARYETYGLPRIAGPGVRLVAAEIEATAVDDGWDRRDALQWLFMDVSHASLRELLDAMATAAGLSGLSMSESQQNVGSGECVERTMATASRTTRWKLSGCSYPDLAGLFAVGVERSGHFTETPSTIDPSVAAVVEALGGRLTRVSVIFGHPTSVGSAVALTASATVAFEAGLTDARVILDVGPLSGWSSSPGEGSVMYSGGIGTRWVVSSGEATLTATGRLVS